MSDKNPLGETCAEENMQYPVVYILREGYFDGPFTTAKLRAVTTEKKERKKSRDRSLSGEAYLL